MNSYDPLEDDSDKEVEVYENQYIICDKCNSIIPNTQLFQNHEIICTGRTSFMRVGNSQPEYLSEKEVFWILRKYIKKQMNENIKFADMPIGSKYLPYAKSIAKNLKIRFSNLQITILHKSDTQIVIRCSW